MNDYSINAIKEINALLYNMNAAKFENIYDGMIVERAIASDKLANYCAPYKNSIGLVSDNIWLEDAMCLKLKREFNILDSNFRLFIKTFKKETKALQLKRHNERKQKQFNK